jgi:hypothetical protein
VIEALWQSGFPLLGVGYISAGSMPVLDIFAESFFF